MDTLNFMIPTLLGLEKLVADEVKRLGLTGVAAENGRVFCTGTGADIARLNLNLRVGARVLVVLGRFEAGREVRAERSAGDRDAVSGTVFHFEG